ncbi:Bgt-5131 [Blumeria graminis f. sp. tritici]|uniref:Class E vacuolar protein-sorting machinery protein HSE1 n=2 Tax=Blumeria graminis f. sp. tritici TaxID=62690 RepID=A0A061HEN3_BLUGR|nr:Membrane bound guanine nucleotide exchange factor [Blumeria graminis f. sp. tritici 96224]VDB94575.1 Bgt-5131 [Blumeria graminis f. sp. tritici]
MNGFLGNAPLPVMYVRALYDYETDDRTSLSFHEGDIIQVITQLESGWWDGVIEGVRGWFPSNYCQVLQNPKEAFDHKSNESPETDGEADETEGSEASEEYEDHYEDEEAQSEREDLAHVPSEVDSIDKDRQRADFWIPQATPDGRLFYFNTETGESSSELPLETPLLSEISPRDRVKINNMPEKTKPPTELMARGYVHDENDESDGNSSVDHGEISMIGHSNSYSRQHSLITTGISSSSSIDSIHEIIPSSRSRRDLSVPNVTCSSSSSFLSTPSLKAPQTNSLSRSFFDDGNIAPLTWNRLVANMKIAVDRYQDAINNYERSEYVRRAEDISDHLRMLLAAGSGTTDNHSGQPSIISSNKALYPHFRDMMSKFSKLVISSHIAAADWPNAESYQKCLQEADGVLQGVFCYVEVARQQRGEDIPRLFPGFVMGNASLIDRLDELQLILLSQVRKLEESTDITDKIITPSRHEAIGNRICSAAMEVLETFKPWVLTIESIDLTLLKNSFENPQLMDFACLKQGLYDNVSDLIISCQAVTSPIGDEWAEAKEESLSERLTHVRLCAKLLGTKASQVGYSLQLIGELVQTAQSLPPRDDSRLQESIRTGNSSYGRSQHTRSESRINPVLRPVISSLTQPFGEGDPSANYPKGENSKVRKFFGEEPTRRDPVIAARTDQSPSHVDEVPDCLKLDFEEDIAYDLKAQPPQLKGGTLMALVEQLTRHDKLDSNFNNTFLLTYRSFTTARELFTLLVQRFQIQPPEGLSISDYEVWRDRKLRPIRFRVVNILKSWFDNFWMEDQSEETKALIREVYTFARDTVKTTETPGSTPLMSVLEKRLRGQDTTAKRLVLTLSQSTPAPIMPKNMKKLKFLDIDVTEFARQLTIVESKLYGKIKPTECLNKTWQKKVAEGEPEPAPNVKALILHSNQLTNWVAEIILTQLDVKKRVVVIKHFVLVADKCRQLNNYSTLTSIISALGTAPIHRLKRTWDQVPAKTIAILESMRRLMGSTKNFGEYRESLHLANPPCIPFFGVYLTDLTFIEDGIPSIIKKSTLINFAKRAKTAEVIRDIQQYQNAQYPLQSVPELQEYILSNMQAASDVHEMYERSLAVEPREREDEKIVRYVS